MLACHSPLPHVGTYLDLAYLQALPLACMWDSDFYLLMSCQPPHTALVPVKLM